MFGKKVMEKSVVEKCRRQVLEKSSREAFQKRAVEKFWINVLERSVWRQVVEMSVSDESCREVL